MQILVVEDEKAVAHMIAMVLGGPASEVVSARSGWEALIKIGATARPFDVVITDHRMPGMTGLHLVSRLRAKTLAAKSSFYRLISWTRIFMPTKNLAWT